MAVAPSGKLVTMVPAATLGVGMMGSGVVALAGRTMGSLAGLLTVETALLATAGVFVLLATATGGVDGTVRSAAATSGESAGAGPFTLPTVVVVVIGVGTSI